MDVNDPRHPRWLSKARKEEKAEGKSKPYAGKESKAEEAMEHEMHCPHCGKACGHEESEK